jgi:PLP dependent protein
VVGDGASDVKARPVSPFEQDGFDDRLAALRHRIAAHAADPDAVRLVAVTKGFGIEAVDAARRASLSDLGENYADELVAKATATSTSADGTTRPTWHYLGSVQRNKVARLSPWVGWWQGVHRIEEGRAIARHGRDAVVLVEVDVTGLPGRGGCAPDATPRLVAALRDEGLDVAGLMAVGAPGATSETRRGFTLLSSLADRLDLPVRSMGMSDDLEMALEEGSTMVRIGRSLFGPRR